MLSIKRRVVALAVAGVSAAMLGGAFDLSQHVTKVSASSPLNVTLGCAQSTNPQAIFFPASPVVVGSTIGGQVNGLQAQPPGAAAAGGALILLNTLSLTANNANQLNTGNTLECGAVMQDATPPLLTAPPSVTCGVNPINDQDCDVNTVDQGNLSYTLANAGGRFAISALGMNATGGGMNGITISCAATSPGVRITPGGPVASFQSDQCLGAVAVTGGVTPNPALEIEVGLAPGVPLSSFGNLSGVAGINFGFSLNATYTRDPALSAALVSAAIMNSGPAVVQAQSLPLSLLMPTYSMTLSASPTTILANPTLNNSTPGVAASGNGGGSTITASMYTGAQPLQVGLGANVTITVGTTTVAGTEPGTVTFVTNNGVFGLPASAQASAQQTVSVACGVVPGSNLAYNPATFSFASFGFSSCTTATATLYGGGSAGMANVVATFVGSITGQQAQNAVAVALSPVPNTQALARGCDEFVTPPTLAANTPIATVVGSVTPSSAVVSVWQFNNAQQGFNALFFSTPGAPTNGNAVGGSRSVFICVSAPASVGNGAY
jgi:hypothetical protein